MQNAFLHGDLVKDVFMEQSLGFVDLLYPTHVYKLDKSFKLGILSSIIL